MCACVHPHTTRRHMCARTSRRMCARLSQKRGGVRGERSGHRTQTGRQECKWLATEPNTRAVRAHASPRAARAARSTIFMMCKYAMAARGGRGAIGIADSESFIAWISLFRFCFFRPTRNFCTHGHTCPGQCTHAAPGPPRARHGWAPDPPMVASGIRSPIRRPGGWVLHQPPWSFGFDSQTKGTRENRRTLGSSRVPHPHRPGLVVSDSTCPPLSSPPHANSFVIGRHCSNKTHTP